MSDKVLKDILFKGFDHLSAIARALKKIQDEAKTEEEAIKQGATLSMVFRAINDIIHPGYASAPELFPEQDLTGFLKDLEVAHKDAVEKKIFPPCRCQTCERDREKD